ncbi:MAG TPA: polysaccharide deacetylase family protein [Kofleriaceae bacterium]|nr:polysaccharide deacetylase family protein [Kofleriaceae bacterium]
MRTRAGTLALALAVAACSEATIEQDPYVPPERDDVVIPAGGTAVSLTFDDGFDTHLLAADLLDQHGMLGTFYLILGRLGGEGYLTLDDVRSLADRRHEIAAHTFTHRSLVDLPPDEAERELCDARIALGELGFGAESFAYPFGASSEEVIAAAERCGYSSARGVGGLYDPDGCTTCPVREVVAPAAPYAILTPNSVIDTTTLEDLQRSVTDAEQAGGGWVVIVIHHLCDDCGELAMSPALLDDFLAWLEPRAAQGTVVATVDQITGGEPRPVVAGPPPARPLSPEQLLANGTLETWPSGVDEPADCWLFGGTGDGRVWDRSSDAASGAYAQHVVVTNREGNTRLVSQQDMGTCATPARGGQRFHFTARYKGTAHALPVAYVRNRLGNWVSWSHAPSFVSPTDEWTEASWSPPGLPDDATAVSFGISLITEGEGWIDDLALSTDE